VTATATLTIPDGYYTLEALQLELARQVFATQMSDYVPSRGANNNGPILSPTNQNDLNRLWHYFQGCARTVWRPDRLPDRLNKAT
jgi:hypothetical protein